MIGWRGPLHVLLCVVLLWQGAAGALVLGRMAAFDPAMAGAICRPGAMLAADSTPEPDDPRKRDAALCALHCAAPLIAAPPSPPSPSAPDRIAFTRADAPAPDCVPRVAALASPPARGPPAFA